MRDREMRDREMRDREMRDREMRDREMRDRELSVLERAGFGSIKAIDRVINALGADLSGVVICMRA